MPRTRTSAPTLAQKLTVLTRDAFSALRAAHPDEAFYFFALYTTEEGSYVVPTAWSEEALARSGHRGRPEDVRFSAADSPYHALDTEKFDRLRGGRRLHDACFDALKALDSEGFFGTGEARAKVLVNVAYGDMSDEQWEEHARGLNPPEAVERVLPYFHLREPSPNARAWGLGVYAVAGLSLSADRKTVAVAGRESDGALGVYRLGARRRAIIDGWIKGREVFCPASALSPDGKTLYLAGPNVVGCDLKSKKFRLLSPTPGDALDVSPDGAALLIGAQEAPARLVDAATGGVRWTAEVPAASPSVAFSPRGDVVAICGPALVVLDAQTGAERGRYATESEALRASPLAWSPDGTRLAVRTGAGDPTLLAWPGLEVVAHLAHRQTDVLDEVSAIAFSPSGKRIAYCAEDTVYVATVDGAPLAKGRGTQESLYRCVFLDEDTVLAAGRDVDSGPAVLEIAISG